MSWGWDLDRSGHQSPVSTGKVGWRWRGGGGGEVRVCKNVVCMGCMRFVPLVECKGVVKETV